MVENQFLIEEYEKIALSTDASQLLHLMKSFHTAENDRRELWVKFERLMYNIYASE